MRRSMYRFELKRQERVRARKHVPRKARPKVFRKRGDQNYARDWIVRTP